MKKFKILSVLLIILLVTALLPVSALAVDDPEISARAAVLANASTGEVYYSKNADATIQPASTTKMVTALIVAEAVDRGEISLGDVVTASDNCQYNLEPDSTNAGPAIVPGEQMTVQDLLYCAMLVSANEACNILAEHVSGSVSAFVDRMNTRAQELGCSGTHFANANGLEEADHYSTAADFAVLAREALQHPLVLEICGTLNYTVAATNKAFRPYKVNWSYATAPNKAAAPVAKAVVDGKANIPEMLTADTWDVVTIQQASHLSWRPDSYHPFGDDLVATIRKLAPQAKIMVQETWAYAPQDRRFAKWSIDQSTMYAKLKAAYAAFAKKYGFEIIPTGDAVQHFRKAMPSPDGITGDPCGSPEGKDKAHFNREGEYLQACVWLGALFNADVTKLAYRPKFLSEPRAVQMRASAKAALDAIR